MHSLKRNNIQFILAIGINFTCLSLSNAQLSSFVKAGLNYGTINQDWYLYSGDSIAYEKPLIRGVAGFGIKYAFHKKWSITQEFMFQIKGQGTIRPDVRSFFQTQNPDILRFMSFPLSLQYRIFSNLHLGLGIQPSLYLSGSDNYYKNFNWRGWIYSTVVSMNYLFDQTIELGFQYDHDLNLYYCQYCGYRFYTIRLYGAYHFAD